MEKVVGVWIGDQTSHNIPVSQSLVCSKALILFTSVKAERGEEAAEEKIEVLRGWFMRFKERSCFHNRKVEYETASADIEASYPEDLTKVINEGGYTRQQIFSVDETAFCWNKMPSGTFIAIEEKSVSGFETSKNRLTLIRAIAGSKFKLEPMLFTTIQEILGSLGIMLYLSTWMTVHLLTTWFTDCFKPTVEIYCSEKKIPFKIVLLIDNVPVHPRALLIQMMLL